MKLVLTLALTCFLSPRRGHTLDRYLKIGAIRVLKNAGQKLEDKIMSQA